MLSSALITFLVSITLFMLSAIVVQLEHRRGRRFVASRLRNWLDVRVVQVIEKWHKIWNHFIRYIVQLGWYYSIHSLLRTVMQLLGSVYSYIEDKFERNRTRAKQLRQERKQQNKDSHLTHIAEHRVETTLSLEEQTKLKKDKLELDH